MDYKEKYNTALERARKIHHETEFDYEKGMMEEIFPELKEPNGEKIRKELIAIFSVGAKVNAKTGDIPDRDIVAWLEKQGHMLHPDMVIEWLECEAFQGWAEPIDIRPIIRKFKKDFHIEPPKKGGEQ